jgi:hypothetical protein
MSSSYDEIYFIKVSDVLDSLDSVQEFAAVELYERYLDGMRAARQADISGDDLVGVRALNASESFCEGYRAALELVSKEFVWLEEEKRQRQASIGRDTFTRSNDC